MTPVVLRPEPGALRRWMLFFAAVAAVMLLNLVLAIVDGSVFRIVCWALASACYLFIIATYPRMRVVLDDERVAMLTGIASRRIALADAMGATIVSGLTVNGLLQPRIYVSGRARPKRLMVSGPLWTHDDIVAIAAHLDRHGIPVETVEARTLRQLHERRPDLMSRFAAATSSRPVLVGIAIGTAALVVLLGVVVAVVASRS